MPSLHFDDFQEYTTTFIDQVSQETNNSPPTTRIVELKTEASDSGEYNRKISVSERVISQPSKKYDEFIEETLDHFRELAEEVADLRSPNDVHQIAERYGQLAWKVMDYEGDFSYSDSSILGVWEDHVEQDEEQFHQYRVIIPLLNFIGSGDSVPLVTDEAQVCPHDDNPFPATKLTISELTDNELSAIMTYEGLRTGDDIGIQPSSRAYKFPLYKLEIELRSNRYAAFGLRSVRTGVDIISSDLFEKADKLGEQVVDALHLQNVNAEPERGLSYLVYKDWRTYREDVQSSDIYRDWMPGYTPTLTNPRYRGWNYELSPDQVTEIQEFWKRYHSVIGQGDEFEEALHRFTQLFAGETGRDDLVDGAIAFESLLTAGPDWGTLSTTIALRGSILLDSRCDHDRKEIWRFLKNLYNARSQVVHDSKDWDEIVADDDIEFELTSEDQPRLEEFVGMTRKMLAQTILVYMDYHIDADWSVGRVNEEIFNAVRDAEFNPDR